MNESASSFLFRVWPYVALTLAVAGFAVRLLVTSDRVPVVKRALPYAYRLFVGGWRWGFAWLVLAAVHLAILLFPRAILGWIRTPAQLFVFEAVGFLAGVAVLAAIVRTAALHLRRPARSGWSLVADFADSVFLSLLAVGIGSGLLAAGAHRWGSAWGAVTLAPYAASLVHGHPAAAFVARLPLLVRLHLFSAFAALAVFPATRLAVFPLVAMHRALAAAGRGLVAAARPIGAWLRRKPAAWLWPDHEVQWLERPAVETGSKVPDKSATLWPRPARDGEVVVKHGGKVV